ncbi:biopolymer transporter ExbD [Sulfurovum sp.]|jgi:biopolymer transport protein ExbD|uniref:ExbD/TolR family protein n=1 Tax=Sulfurovum sp. TaxID=1969726 RepID=UPI002A35CD67|nr:biopolymer transporter ExbD [Sulfurovum sp.]MDD2450803.1 biopolymer transporter ExbD [Sulfurovum sp.]MDD3499121.1 biopolymer transporter ExbD [Sulfurovum sp.]MDY0402191.1 biopolymer transporter ExbD [Sulfurovum sp.]
MMLIDITQNRREKKKLDESMVPAINIVFLLLVFFMIAGRIEHRDAQLHLPDSESEVKFSEQKVRIKVMADGDYYLNEKKVNHSLAEQLKVMALSKDAIVTCHIHRELPATALDPILDAVQLSGIKRLNIATERH